MWVSSWGPEAYLSVQVLQVTEKYCRDRGIPFPRIEVDPKDSEDPRECYLFAEEEDPCSPIVLHFPLVNRTFRTHLAPGKGKTQACSSLQGRMGC